MLARFLYTCKAYVSHDFRLCSTIPPSWNLDDYIIVICMSISPQGLREITTTLHPPHMHHFHNPCLLRDYLLLSFFCNGCLALLLPLSSSIRIYHLGGTKVHLCVSSLNILSSRHATFIISPYRICILLARAHRLTHTMSSPTCRTRDEDRNPAYLALTPVTDFEHV